MVAMDQVHFLEGMSVDAFVQLMEAPIREKFEVLLAESREELTVQQRVSGIRDDLNVVVIAEPWSGDVLYNLPPLLVLAELKGWNVRIFLRDDNRELIEDYKKDGIYLSIPVFVFYDDQFKEIDAWIERPAIATKMIDDESLRLRRQLREHHKTEWRAATYAELIGISKID